MEALYQPTADKVLKQEKAVLKVSVPPTPFL